MKILNLILPTILMTAAAAANAETRYVDASTYFSTTELGRVLLPTGFDALAKKLETEFAAVCPDTFCESSVSNWTPLSLSCTVDQVNHVVGECLWSFAGSIEEIDEGTGKVTVFHENRTCELGFKGTSGRLAEFLLEASTDGGHAFGLLTARVPGREDQATLFGLLSGCL